MWVIIFLNAFAALIYFYIIKPMRYWKNKNVLYEKPLPIFGNMLQMFLKKDNDTNLYAQTYKKFENERYYGIYNYTTPVLVVRDPELLKQLYVKDFDAFPERQLALDREADSLWGKNLFAIKGGEEWHELRATLSPTFTNNKMKIMFGLIKETAQTFTTHFLNKGGLVEIELKHTFMRFANDVIGTIAFGVTCDSFSNPDNDFFNTVQELCTFNGAVKVFLFYRLILPPLRKYIKMNVFPQKVRTFFLDLVKDAIKLRQEKGIVRPDMLHLLLQAQKGQLTYDQSNTTLETGFAVAEEFEYGKMKKKKQTLKIDNEFITAQSIIFFIAGFETVSSSLSYACYELAIHPDIQDRLRKEVMETLQESNDELTYDNLSKMKYLDMVASETLRKWPSISSAERYSVRPYTIKPVKPGEPVLHLEKGSVITCPIRAIHLDPNYFPNPEKFDPERFNETNKHNIKPYTFVPFGIGPRNCIGSRLGLLEIKLLVAEIISKFKIVATEKTPKSIKFSTVSFSPLPDDGIWVGLKPLSKSNV